MNQGCYVTVSLRSTIPASYIIVFHLSSINPDGTVIKDSVTSDHIRVRRKEGYVAAERRLQSRYTNLCCLEEGEVVGRFELSTKFHRLANNCKDLKKFF